MNALYTAAIKMKCPLGCKYMQDNVSKHPCSLRKHDKVPSRVLVCIYILAQNLAASAKRLNVLP